MAKGWGGARPNAGRKKPVVPAEPKRSLPSFDAIVAMVEASKQAARIKPRTQEWNPFRIATHPPRATPPEGRKLQMAQDSALVENNAWASQAWLAGGIFSNAASEGLLFQGYPYLSELAQRPEYRLFAEIRAEEATRQWIKFRGTATEDSSANGIEERIRELTDYFEHLKVRDWFKAADAQDSFFGRSHLFIDTGTDLDQRNNAELKTDIGNGRDAASKGKLKKGCLRGLKTIEPLWVYPTTYNAVNPLLPSWYDPQVWYVMGTEIHRSRLLTFIGRPVPDILKPAYSFGGLSMSQMAQPYVDIWLRTRESVGQLIHAFSVMVLSTNMATLTQPGGADVLARVIGFNALRDNQGTFVIDKATEDFKNVNVPTSGLDQLQAQAQEHLMSVGRIPAVKFTGIQPKGLNATSDGEMRAFNDTISGHQNHLYRTPLTTIMDIAQISLWGKRDPDITFDFMPLMELNEKERAEVNKIKAETDVILVDGGILHTEEARKRVANDPDAPYAGIEVEDVPEEPDAGMPGESGELGEEGPLEPTRVKSSINVAGGDEAALAPSSAFPLIPRSRRRQAADADQDDDDE